MNRPTDAIERLTFQTTDRRFRIVPVASQDVLDLIAHVAALEAAAQMDGIAPEEFQA